MTSASSGSGAAGSSGARQPLSLGRKFVYALLPLVVLVAIAEVIALRVAFQGRGNGSALVWLLDQLADQRNRAVADETLGQFGPAGQQRLYAELYTGDEPLLGELEQRYRTEFAKFARAVRNYGAHLVVVHVPATLTQPTADRVDAYMKALATDLSRAHDASLVDLDAAFSAHPLEAVSLQPLNFHPSRFGNQLVAEGLLEVIAPLALHRAPAVDLPKPPPSSLGDLEPGVDQIRSEGRLPYLLQTNASGFRSSRPLPPRNRDRLRILVIGDSVTFGLFLHETATFPWLLEKGLQDRGIPAEVINAGVLGTTISQQSRLYQERAFRAEPDIVVLQVYFNDLVNLMAWEQRAFLPPRLGALERRRTAKNIRPTALETTFLERLGVEIR